MSGVISTVIFQAARVHLGPFVAALIAFGRYASIKGSGPS